MSLIFGQDFLLQNHCDSTCWQIEIPKCKINNFFKQISTYNIFLIPKNHIFLPSAENMFFSKCLNLKACKSLLDMVTNILNFHIKKEALENID